jgi:hypothetical protein
MVMVNTAGSRDIKTARKFLADSVLLLARIDETCKNSDHATIAKKFVFSNHVNEAFKTLLKTGDIERLEAGLVLTIIHQHLTEQLFSLLDYKVVRTIEQVLMCHLPNEHATHEALNSVA